MKKTKLVLLVAAAIGRIARASHENRPPEFIWQELEHSVTEVFGQTLFTVLAYSQTTRRLCRLYSNRRDISPVRGIKRVTQSQWVDHVLDCGEIFVGSNRDDIKGRSELNGFGDSSSERSAFFGGSVPIFLFGGRDNTRPAGISCLTDASLPSSADAPSTNYPAQTTSEAEPCSWLAHDSEPWYGRTAA